MTLQPILQSVFVVVNFGVEGLGEGSRQSFMAAGGDTAWSRSTAMGMDRGRNGFRAQALGNDSSGSGAQRLGFSDGEMVV
jgi:hypothetical protein